MYGYGYSYPNNTQGSGLMGNYEAGVRSDGGFFAFPIDTGLASRLEALGLVNASSLVNSCNAGKESVLYNLVPTPVQALDRFTVVRAGTKNVLNSSGVLASVANNVPAFEFNADGTYRGLLVEPAGTNLLLRSETFDNAYWTKVGTTVSANSTTAPDGALTADTLTESALNEAHTIDSTAVSVTSGTSYRFSVFAKTNGRLLRMILPTGTFGSAVTANFDLTLGIAYNTAGTGASIENYGNGWYRCSIGITSSVTGSGIVNISMATTSAGTGIYAGDGTSGVFIWGAQLETGSVATSYIPTVASTANRVADSVTLTGASSLIGQSAGTLFAEVTTRITGGGAFDKRILNISIGTTGGFIELSKTSTDELKARVVDTTEQASITTATNRVGTFRLALAYSANDIAFYVNGVQVGTDTSATIPACSAVNIGSQIGLGAATYFNDNIRSVALFPTRLPNTTLASLTA